MQANPTGVMFHVYMLAVALAVGAAFGAAFALLPLIGGVVILALGA